MVSPVNSKGAVSVDGEKRMPFQEQFFPRTAEAQRSQTAERNLLWQCEYFSGTARANRMAMVNLDPYRLLVRHRQAVRVEVRAYGNGYCEERQKAVCINDFPGDGGCAAEKLRSDSPVPTRRVEGGLRHG